MKIHHWCFAFFGLLAVSCGKDQPVIQKDEIVYQDISPDQDIQSVRSYSFQDRIICTANIPTPLDSAITCDLDLNNDLVADFRIRVSHSQYTGGYCGHCDRFLYNIFIEGVTVLDSIAKSSSREWVPKIFKESDTIDQNNSWLSRAELLLTGGCMLPFESDFTNGFVGVKINQSYGYIRIEKISNNGIRILEYGLNKTENNKITCGQKEGV